MLDLILSCENAELVTIFLLFYLLVTKYFTRKIYFASKNIFFYLILSSENAEVVEQYLTTEIKNTLLAKHILPDPQQ
jgi:hypothetical protein